MSYSALNSASIQENGIVAAEDLILYFDFSNPSTWPSTGQTIRDMGKANVTLSTANTNITFTANAGGGLNSTLANVAISADYNGSLWNYGSRLANGYTITAAVRHINSLTTANIQRYVTLSNSAGGSQVASLRHGAAAVGALEAFMFFANGALRFATNNTTLSNNTNHFVSVTYDGTNIITYSSGVTQSSFPAAPATTNVLIPDRVTLSITAEDMKGHVYLVMVHNRALTQAEITALFNQHRWKYSI